MIDILKRCRSLLNHKQQRHMMLILGLMLVSAALEALSVTLIIPFISEIAANRFSVSMTWLIIGLFAVKNGVIYGLKLMQNHAIVAYCNQSSTRLLSVYLNKSYDYFLDHDSRRIITTITIYVTKSFVLINELLNLLIELIITLALLVVMFAINVPIALLASIILLGLTLIIKRCINPRLQTIGFKSNQIYENMVLLVSESIQGIKEIRILDKEQLIIDSYRHLSLENTTMEDKKNAYALLSKPLIETVAITGMLLFILFSVTVARINSEVIIAQAAAFSFILLRIMPSVMNINRCLNLIAYYKPSLLTLDEEISQYIQMEEEVTYYRVEPLPFVMEIHLNQVCFSYRNSPDTTIIDHADFSIGKGEIIGITGPSGAGKTTLIDLIMGYLKPDSGEILVDHQTIHNCERAWMNNISYVPQSIFLMNKSIAENIVLEKSIDEKRLWKVLENVKLADMVRCKADGLKTIIGERGIQLSGGQRQRIGIARALYQQSELLILDEATAALDLDLEREIIEMICSSGRTVIIIAHQPSALRLCSRCYRIDHGRIRQI